MATETWEELEGWEDDDGYCIDCGGEGWLMDCPDDLCHGQGWCMHGDGDRPCPTCNSGGLREPFPEALPRHAVEIGWTPALDARTEGER